MRRSHAWRPPRVRFASSGSSNEWLRRQLSDPYVKKAAASGYRSRASFKLIEICEKHGCIRAGDKVLDLGNSPGGWSQVAAELAKPASSNAPAPIDLVEGPLATSLMTRAGAGAGSGSGSGSAGGGAPSSHAAPKRPHFLQLAGLEAAPKATSTSPAASAAPSRPTTFPTNNISTSSTAPSPSSFSAPPPPPPPPPRRGGLVIGVDLLHVAPIPGVQLVRGDFEKAHVREYIKRLLSKNDGKQQQQGPVLDVLLSDMAHHFTGDASLDHTRQMRLAWRALLYADVLLTTGGNVIIKCRYGDEYAVFREAVAARYSHMREVKPPASRADSAEAYILGLSKLPAQLQAHRSGDKQQTEERVLASHGLA